MLTAADNIPNSVVFISANCVCGHILFSHQSIHISVCPAIHYIFVAVPAFANSVDPDQLASEEANWSGSALSVIKYVNL